MDTLKAEIELKRKSSNNPESAEGQQPTKKKYMRKGDLAKLEAERQIEEKKKKLEAEKIASDALKQRKITDSLKKDSLNSKQANSGSATPNPQTEAENENQPELFNISNEEAVRRLRNKGQPIRLFGESDKERRLRLRALQLIEERTEGGRNELMQALEGVEGKMDLEVLPKHTKDSSKTNHSKSAGLGGAGGDIEGSGNDSDGDLAATQDGEVTVDLNLIKTEPRKIYPQIYFALKVILSSTGMLLRFLCFSQEN
jgi:pre-mRNA-splicing factor 18